MTSEQPAPASTTDEIRLLWGDHASGRGRRGPRPKLTRGEIVAAAVRLADTEGLAAVSMQRVAGALGYTTMSLYRYVERKDDLLLLMVDAAMDATPPGPREDGDWRAGLERWCQEVVALYRAHPWMVSLPVSGPPSGPNGIRWMEAALREICASGLGPLDSLQMLTVLSTVLRETLRTQIEMSEAAERRGTPIGESENAWAQGLLGVLDPAAFPTVTGILERFGTEDEEFDVRYDPDQVGGPAEGLGFGIDRILDGIEAHARARTQA
ncbi:TetR/AcrR family transcriptional regulator [Nocardiopsis sp. HNM0947]|uniref:TetR/AcrR family transcriptional regulator n=1 Tax=Nocardiopsis coralli TaxID=2772213 RepID=A0ABR9P1A5_9ACTN|nr:TetR/AcrR family transcriptional regulator [Nocardiopsis coralli]MBE2997619.1 TetR/AcrR family transcriptional regulator [Nocardiopsis coralli]